MNEVLEKTCLMSKCFRVWMMIFAEVFKFPVKSTTMFKFVLFMKKGQLPYVVFFQEHFDKIFGMAVVWHNKKNPFYFKKA